MTCYIIHSQYSLAVLIKKILSKTLKDAEFILCALDDIDLNILSADDIVFSLQKVTLEEHLKKLFSIKRKAKVVGCFEKYQGNALCFNIDETAVSTTNVVDLTNLLEKMCDSLLNKNTTLSHDFYELAQMQSVKYPRSLDLLLIGVSTGGPGILAEIVENLEGTCPPILIAQHLQKGLSSQLMDFLQEKTSLVVQEVTDRKTPLTAGTITIATAGFDVEIKKEGDNFYAMTKEINNDTYHPSVDRLLESACFYPDAVAAIILSGMGKDGTRGAEKFIQNKKLVLVQDPTTCVVDGMPKTIIDSGFASVVLTPEQIVKRINIWAKKNV